MIFSMLPHLERWQHADTLLNKMRNKLRHSPGVGEKQSTYALEQIAETLGVSFPVRCDTIIVLPLVEEIIKSTNLFGADMSSTLKRPGEITVAFFASKKDKKAKKPHLSVVFFCFELDNPINDRQLSDPILCVALLKHQKQAQEEVEHGMIGGYAIPLPHEVDTKNLMDKLLRLEAESEEAHYAE